MRDVLPEYAVKKLEEQGITELFPPQKEAVQKGLLEGKNLVLAIPTASGKTLVALIAILNHIKNGGKAVYIVPLRALAEEIYAEFSDFCNCVLSSGDYDAEDRHLTEYDCIITTSEKCDSLLRHSRQFFDDVTLVVADEIHLIDSMKRGPTLEMTLSKLKDKQILALSATISNAQEIAEWLKADLVYSEWRPVPLKTGVCIKDKIYHKDSVKEVRFKKDPITSLCYETIKENGQALIFVNTRRSAEALAKKLAKNNFSEVEIKCSNTSFGRLLETCARKGVAFHHAGLAREDRKKVEQYFKENKLKILTATPTLAAGVNLPARRVIVRDYKRYSELGYKRIPVLEIKQMMGRAGRPKYDKEGEALLIAKNEEEKDMLFETYINKETERITSKLANPTIMRTHVLALIASHYVRNEEALKKFLKRTFYSFQYDLDKIYDRILGVIDFLEKNDLIQNYTATQFGKRVSYLYIDPKTAITLRNALKDEMSSFGILHAVTSTPDLESLYLRRGDFDEYDSMVLEKREEFLLDVPDYWYEPDKYEFFLSRVKTASLFYDWMEETDEEEIFKKYKIYPGDFYRIRETGDWLLYSFTEIAKLFNHSYREIENTRKRLRYGVKEELLPLVRIRNIGRVRSRVLFNNGIKNLRDIENTDFETLKRLLGESLARSLK
ncbi:MAG: DEAD/DEAH box helicase [Methanomicrobia archaeon]|nr:DEAD/DEAH box helicase [Methanomicrobia archaeon]